MALPGGKTVATFCSPELLKPPAGLQNVQVAKAPPVVDFLYYPGQDYEGKPWSNWGDGVATPGKIHSRLDMGADGWLYFSTHRGSTKVTTDEYGYKGDWIIRHNPATSTSEVISHDPVGKHCIPCSVLDPDRLIFYGGTVQPSCNLTSRHGQRKSSLSCTPFSNRN
ncbi:MAG: hypothetical protein A2Z25_22385 [Planctomycetes bacterium RBG_16_55_9]|nr:MAG: hypothetical protein A2Z25_22385 [Planctomycetes bacterium RBG_16_55_9]